MACLLNCCLTILTLPIYGGTHILIQNVTNRRSEKLPEIPRIVEAPVDHYSTDGFLEFTCRAEGNPQPIIQWYNSIDKQLVTDRIPSVESLSGIHVNKHYGRLMISNPTRGTLYSFYCNASNEVGWTVSDRAVQGGAAYLDKIFQLAPQNRTVNAGTNVTILCEPPTGIPQPLVFWIRDGKAIIPQENHTTDHSSSFSSSPLIVTPEGYLQIYHVQPRHGGRYICGARNMVAERYAPAMELVVRSSVTMIEIPKQTRVRQGQTAIFRCQADGAQSIHWERGYGEGDLDFSRMKVDQGQLTIQSARISDAGTYVCHVPNTGDYNATLTVDSPPSFVQTPRDLTEEVGQVATFRCLAQGHPKPSIYWELPNKTPVFPSDSDKDQKYTVYPDGSLRIKDLKTTDEGKYQCTAHSSIDTIHSSAKLRVIPRSGTTEMSFPSNFDDLAPSRTPNATEHVQTSVNFPIPFISQPPCNQTRMVGESVLFTCDVGNRKWWKQMRTSSRLSVRWIRMFGTVEQPIESLNPSDSHRFRVLRTGSLQISSLQPRDSGLYRCVLRSSAVHLQKSITVVILAEWTAKLEVVNIRSGISEELCQDIILPSPRNLKASNVTATSVTLVWEPLQTYPSEISSTGQRTISYRVEYLSLTESSNSWVTVEQNWPMNTVYLTGLIPDTIYYFLVRSRWMHGRIGRSSDPLGPVHTPSNLINSPSASVPYFSGYRSHNHIPDIREHIKRVQIDHIQFQVLADSQVHVQWSVTEGASVLNLINGFTIRAQEVDLLRCVGSILEQKGQTARTDRQFQSPLHYCSLQYSDSEGFAGMVYRLEGLQRLHTDSAGSASKPVVITTDINHSPISPVHNEISTQQYQGTVRTLRPFQCYELQISARISHAEYGKLESSPSDPKFILTSERAPSAPPSSVSVAWVAKSRAHIRWSAPIVSSWNGLLTGYVIQIYGELTQEPQIVNASHTIFSIDVDLPPRPEAYLVQVAAVTCAGVGVSSPPIRLVPTMYRSDLNASLQVKSTVNQTAQLLTQPWFVGTMIGSIVAWCTIIALVAFFCCRKRFSKANKTHRTVLSPPEVRLRSTVDMTSREAKATLGIRGDSINMESLLSDGNYAGEQNGNSVSQTKVGPFAQSRSFGEYLAQTQDALCPQLPVESRGQVRNLVDNRPSGDGRTGHRSQSLSSGGGRSSTDAVNHPVLVMSSHTLSNPEPMDMVNQREIPQSYSISPSQYGWQSPPGSYPHDILPPFQNSCEVPPPNILSFRPNGASPHWINKRNESLERGDGDSENFYPLTAEPTGDNAGVTPYATASIFSTSEMHGVSGCLVQKTPLSTICSAGVICYPCGNTQSSSDQTSYTSNSDRYRTRPCRGYIGGRYEENSMAHSYPVHSLADSAASRSSKTSRSPTASISRSSSRQQNKSQSTALTTTTTAASTEHSLNSSRVTPQEEEEEEQKMIADCSMPHADHMNGPTKTTAEGTPYPSHFDQLPSRRWSRSSRNDQHVNKVKNSVTASFNEEHSKA